MHRSAPRGLFRAVVCRQVAVVAVAFGFVCLAAGASFAYWTASGSGTGSANAGTISMAATVATGSDLFPGAGGTVPVSFTVKNTSATGSLAVTSVVPSSGAGRAGCARGAPARLPARARAAASSCCRHWRAG